MYLCLEISGVFLSDFHTRVPNFDPFVQKNCVWSGMCPDVSLYLNTVLVLPEGMVLTGPMLLRFPHSIMASNDLIKNLVLSGGRL